MDYFNCVCILFQSDVHFEVTCDLVARSSFSVVFELTCSWCAGMSECAAASELRLGTGNFRVIVAGESEICVVR